MSIYIYISILCGGFINPLLNLPLTYLSASDPQGDQAPLVKPSVHLHHPGSLHGDCSCCWVCSFSREVPGAAVQPHDHLSQSAVRSVLVANVGHLRVPGWCKPCCDCLSKVWQLFHVRVWAFSWAACWWRSWTCRHSAPSAWPCWSTWSPPPVTSHSCSWAVTRVPSQEWLSHTTISTFFAADTLQFPSKGNAVSQHHSWKVRFQGARRKFDCVLLC